jgi:hypothetical protein
MSILRPLRYSRRERDAHPHRVELSLSTATSSGRIAERPERAVLNSQVSCFGELIGLAPISWRTARRSVRLVHDQEVGNQPVDATKCVDFGVI